MSLWKRFQKAVEEAGSTPATPVPRPPARRAASSTASPEPKAVKLLSPNVPEGWEAEAVWSSWSWPVSVVSGESHHHDELMALTGPPRNEGYAVPVPVELILEPTNQYDPNAVRVEVRGSLVGYINGKDAPKVTANLKAVGVDRVTLAGILTGGAVDFAPIGVLIWHTKRISASPKLPFTREQERPVRRR